ncbi:AlpA family transcriptional regulator [Pseudovibrio sp. JE062]|uniref:helix-turn-helix transcriptional regulator n=1 Tax=Pseudovibrio sp. JE062 TaxID=439495 RepID=UPI000186C760|nr:putative regulatory protein encoded in prophage CP-933I [Pseudovibrio sp. JE062]
MSDFHDRYLARPEVEAVLGLSRSTIYKLLSEDDFPPPTRLIGRSVRWRLSEIMSWAENKRKAQTPN